ncbi:MAG: rhomboid family intramembrane serine protease [Vicinamibacteria bacterium]
MSTLLTFAAVVAFLIGVRSFLRSGTGAPRPVFQQNGIGARQLSEGLLHALISDRGFIRPDTRIEQADADVLVIRRDGAAGRLVLIPARALPSLELSDEAASLLKGVDSHYGSDRTATLVIVGGDASLGRFVRGATRKARLLHVRDDGSVMEARRGFRSAAPRLVIENALDRMADDLREGAFPHIEWDTARALVRAVDESPLRPQPPLRGVVTSALSVAIALCFAAEVAFSRDALLGEGAGLAVVYRMGGVHQPSVLAGEWQRLIASPFLHFGLLHIVMNGWAQWTLGGPLEFLIGSWRFLALWIASGLGASLTSLAFNDTSVSAGASGAIFGLLGAFTTFVFFRKDILPQPVPKALRNGVRLTLLLNLLISFIPSIDMAAHVGGFVSGALIAFGLGRHDRWTQLTAGSRLGLRLIVAMVVALGVGVTTIRHQAYAATTPPDQYQDHHVGDVTVQIPSEFTVSETQTNGWTTIEADGNPASPYSLRFRISAIQQDDAAAVRQLKTLQQEQGPTETTDWIAVTRGGTQNLRAIEITVVAPSSLRATAEEFSTRLARAIR